VPEKGNDRSHAIRWFGLATAVVVFATALVGLWPKSEPAANAPQPVIVQPIQNVIVNPSPPSAPAPAPTAAPAAPAPVAPVAPVARAQDKEPAAPEAPRAAAAAPSATERRTASDQGWTDQQSSVVIGDRRWSKPCGAAGMPACN
jgi:type IV secretory pathway VirB10-like protein